MRRPRYSRLLPALVAILALLGMGATVLSQLGWSADRVAAWIRPEAVYPVSARQLDEARARLDALPVRGRAPRTGYERELFGPPWSDVDGNGCDTRNDVLRSTLRDPVVRPDGCVVLAGVLHDPYSGADLEFSRGAQTSARVQIDHVVPLADAWQKGAQRWDARTRLAFANDPANLLAVDGSLNRQKGAGDAATWLPPNTGFRCQYAVRQITVKDAYGLWVTDAERQALDRLLDRCHVAGR